MPTPLTSVILASIGLFLLGLGGGWFLSKLNRGFDRPPVQTAIAILITIVWVVAVTAEILVPAYSVSMMLHSIMGVVVGYLFSEDGITVNLGQD